MPTTRTIAAASLTALALLGGCSKGSTVPLPSPPPEPAPSTTASTLAQTSTSAPPSVASALLAAADVPGSTATPATPGSADLSACFPASPLGSKNDPAKVTGPDLVLTDASGVQRQYGSSARRATTEQAAAFLTAFASATGSACAVDAFKSALTNSPPPPKVDASGLNGPVTTTAVGEGGVLVDLSGSLVSDGTAFPAEVELLLFRKGPVVVFLSVATSGGPKITGQAVELASRIAGRLPA